MHKEDKNVRQTENSSGVHAPTCSAYWFHGTTEYRNRNGLVEARNQLNPEWVTVGESEEQKDRALSIGQKIQCGDYFVAEGKVYPATDIGSGIMSAGHYPHFRPNDKSDSR